MSSMEAVLTLSVSPIPFYPDIHMYHKSNKALNYRKVCILLRIEMSKIISITINAFQINFKLLDSSSASLM